MAQDFAEFPLEVTPPLVEAHELYRFYHIGDDETLALRGVTLTVAPGEVVAITGPSGSGKSTLLSCLAGLDEPDGGYVVVAGARITRRPEPERAAIRARNLGVLMQSGNLFDHLSVADNVKMQLHLAGKSPSTVSQTVSQTLAAVGLEDRKDARLGELSGGEAARAGLAVAMAAQPSVLIADEPTGDVDATTETLILDALQARAASGGAVILATHSREVAAAANRVIRLRDGRIVDD